MSDNRLFLQTLSRIMDESYQPTALSNTIRNISSLINDKLLPEINGSVYPSSPAVLKKLNELTYKLRIASTFSKMTGKRVVYIHQVGIDNANNFISFLCESKISIPPELTGISIPLVFLYGKSTDITAVNFADISVSLTQDELSETISNCKSSNVSIESIIKALIVSVPFKYKNLCLILDKDSDSAFDLFDRQITDIFVYDSNNKRYLGILSTLPNYRGMISHIEKSFISVCSKDANYFNSFEDALLSVCSEIEVYYGIRLDYLVNAKKIVTSDIVRKGSAESILTELRSEEDEDIRRLTAERNILLAVFDEIRLLFKEADTILSDGSGGAKPLFNLDRVAERLFLYSEAGMIQKLENDIPEQLERCIKNSRQEVIAWLLDYSDFMRTGILAHNAKINIKKPAHIRDWKKAKVYSAIAEINKNDPLIKECIHAIENVGKPLTTGREMYLKAITMSSDEAAKLLIQSYKTGLLSSGSELWNMYYKNSAQIDLQKMADLQIPEFCVKLSEDNISESKRKNISFTNPDLIYLKYAASKEYEPAIALIIDTLYQANFNELFTKERKGTSVPYIRSDNNKELAGRIVELCKYLITKGYRTTHFRKIGGLLLFLLRDMNSSMKMLSGVNNKLSYYCKAYMYETGNGTVRNLEAAVSHYQMAGNALNAEERLANLENKIEEDEEDEYTYDKNKSYHSTTSYSSSSDGCVTGDTLISMADGSLKRVDELLDTDEILTWDMLKGSPSPARLMGFHKVKSLKNKPILKAVFDDNTSVSIIEEHLFFDIDLNRFIAIYIGADNTVYLGHRFAKISNDGIKSVTLLNIVKEGYTHEYYAPVPERHFTYMVNGMISANAKMLPICNRFVMDKKHLKYNAEMRTADINKYSPLPYENVKQIVSKEFFERNYGSEFGVSIGKQLISEKELIEMITYYRDYLFDNNA